MRPTPTNFLPLMPQIDALLIELLEQLKAEDWDKPTIAPKWTIKDIAVHLLDGNLRTLSILRDHYNGDPPTAVHSYEDLVAYLNRLNADWVQATKRLSPRVIIDLLKASGREYVDFLHTLDLQEKATFSVAWAGEEESKNWFHIAREYTEKWHHQQQIRLALGKDAVLLQDKWYLPYLDTSVRALPHHYREAEGEKEDLIQFSFVGETEKSWYLHFNNGWNLLTANHQRPTCKVRIPDTYVWRIFTKGIPKEEAIEKSTISGKRVLGLKIFDMLAVMA